MNRELTWRNAATTENRNVAFDAKDRETCVFRLPASPGPEAPASRLRGTAQATGNPAIRFTAA